MKLRNIIFITLLLLINSLVFGQNSSSLLKSTVSVIDSTEVQTVKYCDLIGNPENYIGKFIRIEAIYRNLITMESILYDDCKPKLSSVSVSINNEKLDEVSNKILSKVNSLDNRKVTVVGKFLGSRKADSKFNYGHYGWSKYLFEIHAFENIVSVSEK